MPTLFVDSGSFNHIQVSGSLMLSGSTTLQGTASFALTASYVLNAVSSSFASTASSVINGLGAENYKRPSRWHVVSSIDTATLLTIAVTSGSAGGITTLIVPFVITKPTTITSMSFEVTSAPATLSSASVGIYSSNIDTTLPNFLITSMSNIGVTTGAGRVYSGSLTTGAITLNSGLYYTAFQHSGSATMTVRSIQNSSIPNIIGLTTPGNTSVPNYYAGVRSSAGSAAFLPSSTSSFTTMNPLTAASQPAIWILFS